MRNRIRVNQLNIGWMASDGEDRIQREYHRAKTNWLEEAASEQPFGRLLAPAEVARAVNFLVSAESGMMTGSVINFDQSVWGAYPVRAAHSGVAAAGQLVRSVVVNNSARKRSRSGMGKCGRALAAAILGRNLRCRGKRR